MTTQKERVGGTDAVPIFKMQETTRDGELTKYVVGDTGVAFDSLEGAQAAAKDLARSTADLRRRVSSTLVVPLRAPALDCLHRIWRSSQRTGAYGMCRLRLSY